MRGHADEAEQRLDASAAAFGELGDWGGMSWALGLLAWVRFTQGRLDEAAVLAERILREATELGNRWAAAIMRVLLANVALWRGEPAGDDRVRDRVARATFQELGDPWGELQSLGPMALALNACLRTTEAKAMVDDGRTSSRPQVPDLVDEPARRRSSRVAIAIQAGDPDGVSTSRLRHDRRISTGWTTGSSPTSSTRCGGSRSCSTAT